MHKTWTAFTTTLRREKLLSLTNISAMTVTFFFLGIFVTVGVISQTAITLLEDQAQTTIFFKDDFPENSIINLKETLESDARISSVVYISKQDAFNIFKEINKDDPILLEAITPDILPASLEIKTEDINDLSIVAGEFESLDGVEEVKFFEDVISRFRNWTQTIYAYGIILMAMFFLISYSVVVVTLRMTINSKGAELEIMKLVGASDSYVKSPLLLQGVFFGFVSAVASSVLLLIVYLLYFEFNVFNISGLIGLSNYSVTVLRGVTVTQYVYLGILSLVLVISGVILGYLGSWTAVRKYLKY